MKPPILADKHPDHQSVFRPENLLREARRQKRIADAPVPRVCVLDPDGDIVRQAREAGVATRHPGWACYHSEMWALRVGETDVGVVPCAVGASYAVLVAEQMFASGCDLLISITSAGQLEMSRAPPYFVLIERALRDEGTSYHYQPPAEFADANPALLTALDGAFDGLREPVVCGATWTTDAPFRETADAIAAATARGLVAVEMEAAALYAFAAARNRRVVCFAHVTNQMARIEGDFEKGDGDGSVAALAVVTAVIRTLAAQ